MSDSDDLSPAQLKKYLDRRVGDVACLLKAVAETDSDTIREITHRIKGNAALYGFPAMGHLAGKIVKQVDESVMDWPLLGELTEALAEQVDEELKRL